MILFCRFFFKVLTDNYIQLQYNEWEVLQQAYDRDNEFPNSLNYHKHKVNQNNWGLCFKGGHSMFDLCSIKQHELSSAQVKSLKGTNFFLYS